MVANVIFLLSTKTRFTPSVRPMAAVTVYCGAARPPTTTTMVNTRSATTVTACFW